MNSRILAWAQTKGLQPIDGHTLAGVLDGIPIGIKKQNKTILFFLSVQTNARQAGVFSGQMAQYGPEFGILQTMSEGTKIIVLCTPKKTLTVQQLDRLTGILIREVRRAGMTARTCCEICGHPVRTVVLRDSRILVVCDKCAAHAKQKIRQGSLPAGLAGALLGALAGMAPWILLTLTSGFYMGYLSVLIAIASFAGYRWLDGRRSRQAAFHCVLFSTLIALFLSEITCYLSSFTIEEWGETVGWYLQSLLKGDEAVISNGLVALLCALAGIVLVFIKIKRYVYAGQVRELFGLPQEETRMASVADAPCPAVLTRR